MANEYLKRTPTSTGNRRVLTISCWVKLNTLGLPGRTIFSSGYLTSSTDKNQIDLVWANTDRFQFEQYGNINNTGVTNYYNRDLDKKQRDVSSWAHILISYNSTLPNAIDRAKIYVNGIREDKESTSNEFPLNYELPIGTLTNGLGIKIGNGVGSSQYGTNYFQGELFDYFFIDGQALTPDIFGFYKDGEGYISAGTSQSTDFRPGQWVPKSPRIIKSEINRRGGFGVNGFYLPMNSSNNFGADFHCTPDTILRLKEALPQPKAEIDGNGDYTNALRDDPFKQYLVLAIPFVSGGLQNGFGDYSAVIRGYGSAKTVTANNLPDLNSAQSLFYGSSLANNIGGLQNEWVSVSASQDFLFGTEDFTVEGWFWPERAQTLNARLFGCNTNNSAIGFDVFLSGSISDSDTTGQIRFHNGILDTGFGLKTEQWSHVVLLRDSNVVKCFVNGICVATSSYSGNIGNSTYEFRIGQIGSQYSNPNDYEFRGYIQDVRVYKGVAKYKGGFDVPKPYTPVGIATWRAVSDTTANNFATLNPLAKSNQGDFYYTNGNLTTGKTVTNYYNQSFGTISVNSGKWYWEVNNTAGLDLVVGVSNSTQVSYYQNNDSTLGASTRDWVYASWNGNKGHNGFSSYGSTFQSSSAIIGIALDMDNGTIEFYNNGTSQGIAFSGISVPTIPVVGDAGGQLTVCTLNFGQNPTFSGNITAGTYTDSNGKGLFKYEPPAGFLALCSDNLPTPAISDPGKYFKTVLYTGDDNIGHSIGGVGFKPDLIWLKGRSGLGDHGIWDTVRGAPLRLRTNTTDSEASSTGILSIDDDGFSLGNTGYNYGGPPAATYVAWCWKAGVEAVTNTDGTITSQVSVNQDAGFSIVSYTGDSNVSSTVGHGLEKTPSFIILKSRTSSYYWRVYHSFYGTSPTQGLLIGPAPTGTTTSYNHDEHGGIGSVSPSIFGFGTNGTNTLSGVNKSGETYIAYCWAEIEGFNKFGSYVGNGSDDGPFVYCGFKPAWVMIKNASVNGYWNIWDSSRSSMNPADRVLFPNVSDIEEVTNPGVSNYNCDLLSNGFKIRTGSATHINGSGNTIIFAAFAESPFPTANAK